MKAVFGIHLVRSSVVPSKSSWKVHDQVDPSALRGCAPQSSYVVGAGGFEVGRGGVVGGVVGVGVAGAGVALGALRSGIDATNVRLRRLLEPRNFCVVPADTNRTAE